MEPAMRRRQRDGLPTRLASPGVTPDEAAFGKRIARPSVTGQVVDILYEALRGGDYQAGDRLPSEQELARSLGVGRSAIREAVQQLLTLDMVEIQPGKGTFVRPVNPGLLVGPESFHDVLDQRVAIELLEVRLIVEPEAAALAATRRTDKDIRRLARDVANLAMAIPQGRRPPEDVGFHLDVVRAAHNGALLRVSTAITAFYGRDQTMPSPATTDEHRTVLEAIEARDGASARSLMIAHLEIVGMHLGGKSGNRPDRRRSNQHTLTNTRTSPDEH